MVITSRDFRDRRRAVISYRSSPSRRRPVLINSRVTGNDRPGYGRDRYALTFEDADGHKEEVSEGFQGKCPTVDALEINRANSLNPFRIVCLSFSA